MVKTQTIQELEYEMEMVSEYVLSITRGLATGYVAVTGHSHGEPVYGYTTEGDNVITNEVFGNCTIASPIRESSDLAQIIDECANKLSSIDIERQNTVKAIEGGTDRLRSWT